MDGPFVVIPEEGEEELGEDTPWVWQGQRDLGRASQEEPPPSATSGGNKSVCCVSEALYCTLCNMWLNGPAHFEDHKKGPIHRMRTKRLGTEKCSESKIQFAPLEQGRAAPTEQPGEDEHRCGGDRTSAG